MSVLEFSANDTGRDLVAGDVHGCFRTLERALTAVGFDGEHDRLFGVGDLVARGPDSAEALTWIETRFAGVTRGNHEDAAMTWLADRLEDSTEAPYGWLTSIAPEQYQRWHDALARLPLAITIETAGGRVGIVHAESPQHSWRRATELLSAGRELDVALLGWPGTPDTRRRYRSRPVEGLRALVHGHEPVAAVEQTANRWNIDTGAGFPDGHLTLARIDSDPIEIVTMPCG